MDKATQMLRNSLISAYMLGDLAAAIYYGSIVGNGLVEVGQPEAGLGYCEIALKTAATIKDMGLPFMAYEGKARALLALHREAEAKSVLDQALAQARAQGAHPAEAQLLIVAGKQAAASDPNQAIRYLTAAINLSATAGFQHVLAWGAFELAKVYRDTGDANNAEKYATEAVRAMRQVLPVFDPEQAEAGSNSVEGPVTTECHMGELDTSTVADQDFRIGLIGFPNGNRRAKKDAISDNARKVVRPAD